jgi:hypothetical protein
MWSELILILTFPFLFGKENDLPSVLRPSLPSTCFKYRHHCYSTHYHSMSLHSTQDDDDYYGIEIPLDEATELLWTSSITPPCSSYGSDISIDDDLARILDSSTPPAPVTPKTPIERFRNGILDIADFTGPAYCNYKASFSSFCQLLMISFTCEC